MLGRKVEGVKPVSLPHVRAILEQRSGEPDFGYEQQMSLDYARKFAKLTPADADRLAADLAEFDALKPETITKLVDLLPAHPSTMQAILAKDRITLPAASATKVMEKIAHYRTKMVAPPEATAAPAGGEAVEEAGEKKAEEEGKKAKGAAAAKEKPVESESPLDASAAEGKAAAALVKSEKEDKAKAPKADKSDSKDKAKKEKGEDKHAK